MTAGRSEGASYVPIRDDAGLRSLSLNERAFLRSCALSGVSSGDGDGGVLRDDGRDRADVRKIRCQLGRWDNGAECTVQWGVGTRVTSLCSSSLVPPSPDRPSDGIVNFTVDLSPMACTGFLQAPPVVTAPTGGGNRGPNYSDTNQRLLSNRILRCLERIILVGGALDTEALVILPGKWVWRLNVSLTVLDHGGNLLDACVFAAIAALRHYRKPHVDLSSSQGQNDGQVSVQTSSSNTAAPELPTLVPSIVKEATPLPLHHTPLSISFALIPTDEDGSTTLALVDPNDREELVQLGSFTVAMNVHSEVCLLDYGGGCELTPLTLKKCCKVAETSVKHLCQLLEGSLNEADDQANQDRLFKLQQQQHPAFTLALPPPPIEGSGTLYFQQANAGQQMEVDSPLQDNNGKMLTMAQTSADEAYRRQALDYSKGHVASAVRENDDPSGMKSSFDKQSGSLLAAMLRSVKGKEGGTEEGGKMVDGDATVGRQYALEVKGKGQVVDSMMATEAKPVKLPAITEATSKPKVSELIEASTDNAQLDSDEEETTEVLQSEFASATFKDSNKQKETPPAAEQMKNVDKADITDLAMAIKKKKKSKSKKKK